MWTKNKTKQRNHDFLESVEHPNALGGIQVSFMITARKKGNKENQKDRIRKYNTAMGRLVCGKPFFWVVQSDTVSDY